MPLLDGIIGCWSPSIRGSGYLLPDLSGRGNHGTLTNMDAGTDWPGAAVRGVHGRVLDFDGTNDFADFGTRIDLGGAKFVSFSAWLKPNGTNNMWALSRYSSGLGSGVMRTEYFGIQSESAAGQIRFNFGGQTNNDGLAIHSSEVVTASEWNHIAGSVLIAGASSTGVMTLNGKPCTVNLTTSGTPPTEVSANNAVTWRAMAVTGFAGNVVYSAGQVGEMAIWRTPKAVAELCELHRQGNGAIGRQLTGQTRRRVYGFVPATGARRRRILCGDYS